MLPPQALSIPPSTSAPTRARRRGLLQLGVARVRVGNVYKSRLPLTVGFLVSG